MPPNGQFHASPDAASAKHYLGFAAGSGITPILSIVTTLLRTEPGSRVTLFYGNRAQRTTMFIDDLYALKNRYPERLQLHFLFSREEQEFPDRQRPARCGQGPRTVRALLSATRRRTRPSSAVRIR